MVGVPRSQGCRQCRRRKKGCDLTRPTCGQCERLAIQCTWDESRWTFVQQTMQPVEAGPSRPSRLSIGRISEPSGRSATSRPPSESPPPRPRTASSASSSAAAFAAPAPLPAIPPQRTIGERTPLEIQVVEMFWQRWFPDSTGLILVDRSSMTPYKQAIQQISASDETANLALRAAAFTALGRSLDNENMLQQGSRFYGRALLATNRALQRPEMALTDAMLVTTKFLAFYETWRSEKMAHLSSQGHDYQKHVLGTCRLMEMRGPERHVDLLGHRLFSDARMNSIILALTLRRATFFTGPGWQTIPWRNTRKTLRDELCDTLAKIPDLLRRFDVLKLHQNTAVAAAERVDVLRAGVAVGEELRQWETTALAAAHEASRRQAQTLPTESSLDPVLDTPALFEACTQFDYHFGLTVMTFWASSLSLYNQLALELHTLRQSRHHMRGQFSLPNWMARRPLATNIAKCLCHFFRPQAGLWSSQAVAFPVGAALHFYSVADEDCSIERDHIRAVLRDFRSAAATAGFLRSLASSTGTGSAGGSGSGSGSGSAAGGVGGTTTDPAFQGIIDCDPADAHRQLARAWFGASEELGVPSSSSFTTPSPDEGRHDQDEPMG